MGMFKQDAGEQAFVVLIPVVNVLSLSPGNGYLEANRSNAAHVGCLQRSSDDDASDRCAVYVKNVTTRGRGRQLQGVAVRAHQRHRKPRQLPHVCLELQHHPPYRYSHTLHHEHYLSACDRSGPTLQYLPTAAERRTAPCGTTKTTIRMVPSPAMIPTRRMSLA
jgi:hypothetical protein